MRAFASIICTVIICATAGVDVASAQQSNMGCASEPGTAQTLRCRDGLIIVAEDGAKFTLQGRGSEVSGVDLQSKAVLVDAPRQKGKSRFQVITPRAVAAVRGTKWAVDAQQSRTSVLVLSGQVAVRRPKGGGEVVLGAGDGVDVEPGTDALVVKRWAQPRIDALLARLKQ
jgi:hypothetical protein